MLSRSTRLRDALMHNTDYYRKRLAEIGLRIKPGTHPITPIMLGDAALAQKFAAKMLERGVYVVGFFFPVVPRGQARIRTQISTVHRWEDLDFALEQFAEVKRELAL